MCVKNSGILNGKIKLSDTKPCLNWDNKFKVCNVIYTAIISPKGAQWSITDFYKGCNGVANKTLCCAFQNPYDEIRVKKIDIIPNVRIFEA